MKIQKARNDMKCEFISCIWCQRCLTHKINSHTNVFLLFFSGAIFEQGTDEIQAAFKHAMVQYNMNNSQKRFELQAFVDVINTADAFKLSRLSE